MLRRPLSVAQHSWKLFRTGGLLQVSIETAEDILALPTLDQKLWVALSCPVNGLELDERTLELIDTDHDGQIHVPEVLQAIEWTAARLRNPADLLGGAAALPVVAINDAGADTRVLVDTARDILKRLGKPEAEALTPDDFADPAKVFPATALNGDGVLSPGEVDDAEVQALIKDIINAGGSVNGRDGNPGVTPQTAETFFAQLADFLQTNAQSADKEIAVLGDRTAAACSAVAAVRAKVEEFFERCRLAAFEPRALVALHQQETEFLAVAAKDLVVTNEELGALPLARMSDDGTLTLDHGVNPAWVGLVAVFRRDAVVPFFGPDKRTLTFEEWRQVNDRLAPYETWRGRRVGAAVEWIGVDRAKAIVGGDLRAKLQKLFAADARLQPEREAIAAVERLVRYHRDLRALINNFINFEDFYSCDRWAIFQAGKLYLDSRACELCIQVDDPAAHALLATMSKAYIAYLECHRGSEVMRIAACFTQGDSDYLFVGRNGLFYDRRGRDWHATITKIIDSPISLREAFWSPYKKVIRAIEEQVAKRAAAADAGSVAGLTAAATARPAGGAPAPKPVAAAGTTGTPARKLDLSSIIGLSVALGSIGTFLATVFGKFVELPAWQVPLVVIALMFTISLPSILITWMKLRQRNLGPILEANGWAINRRVKINVPFGTALTERAKIPAGALVRRADPYANEHPVRTRAIVYGTLAVLTVATLLYARYAEAWPFAPAAQERAALKQILEKPLSTGVPVPTSSTAAPAK
jgi:hypothetical protein